MSADHTISAIARIDAIVSASPQLANSERTKYDRICTRLCRAQADLRRATKRGDAKKIASAERSITRAKTQRSDLLAPTVSHLWAPEKIIYKSEGHWSGPSGSGVHRWACEMILDYKDLSGPQYRTVRVLKDEGGPPTNARSAPTLMGVAWWAINDQIKRGWIVVLDEEAVS